MKKIIWWGRSDYNYSRNRIIRKIFYDLGYEIIDFFPLISSLGYYEAFLRTIAYSSFVWVPCFRHRDLNSAYKWSKKNNIPLIFDPLISSWDKSINERKKFNSNSFLSKILLKKESKLFSKANIVIADTFAHKKFFYEKFNIQEEKIKVVFVGAEEALFIPGKKNNNNEIKEILFYGSFLELHGINSIIKASKIKKNNKIIWTIIGDKKKFPNYKNLNNINFENFVPYEKLANRINQADVLLGIFSESEKANNVIPNKVFQALACGKPVITRKSNAYPTFALRNTGMFFVNPSKPTEIYNNVIRLCSDDDFLTMASQNARLTYEKYFSEKIIKKQILEVIKLATVICKNSHKV
jgi:glycosyltransferase involved in cell wall biosynthesis